MCKARVSFFTVSFQRGVLSDILSRTQPNVNKYNHEIKLSSHAGIRPPHTDTRDSPPQKLTLALSLGHDGEGTGLLAVGAIEGALVTVGHAVGAAHRAVVVGACDVAAYEGKKRGTPV